jgi:uncharacterized membrane protein
MTALFIICAMLALFFTGALLLLAVVLNMFYDPDPCTECNYNCNQGRACPYRKEKV